MDQKSQHLTVNLHRIAQRPYTSSTRLDASKEWQVESWRIKLSGVVTSEDDWTQRFAPLGRLRMAELWEERLLPLPYGPFLHVWLVLSDGQYALSVERFPNRIELLLGRASEIAEYVVKHRPPEQEWLIPNRRDSRCVRRVELSADDSLCRLPGGLGMLLVTEAGRAPVQGPLGRLTGSCGGYDLLENNCRTFADRILTWFLSPRPLGWAEEKQWLDSLKAEKDNDAPSDKSGETASHAGSLRLHTRAKQRVAGSQKHGAVLSRL